MLGQQLLLLLVVGMPTTTTGVMVAERARAMEEEAVVWSSKVRETR